MPHGLFQTWNKKPPFDCFVIEQVHGVDFLREGQIGQADGIFAQQQQPWAIKTADCMPVVVSGAKGFVFFHAGWRGLKQNIQLQPQVAAIKPEYAFVGPHISAENFIVTQEFKQYFPHSPSFFSQNSQRLTFDLFAQLNKSMSNAYPGIRVEACQLCTFEQKELHSYRRNKTSQRNWNIFTSCK